MTLPCGGTLPGLTAVSAGATSSTRPCGGSAETSEAKCAAELGAQSVDWPAEAPEEVVERSSVEPAPTGPHGAELGEQGHEIAQPLDARVMEQAARWRAQAVQGACPRTNARYIVSEGSAADIASGRDAQSRKSANAWPRLRDALRQVRQTCPSRTSCCAWAALTRG